ncbi:MAG: FG-GAP-like repeat-containing protein, partial [Bacteroidota bacterium]
MKNLSPALALLACLCFTTNIVAQTFSPNVDFATGVDPRALAIGDLDGDSKPDIVVANLNSGTVSVFRNTSVIGTLTAASLAPKVDFATGGGSPWAVALGDIDGDGKLDIVIARYSANRVSVFRNTSTIGSVSFAAMLDFTTGTQPNAISISDIDGDGKLDVVVTNLSSLTASVFRNTSSIGSVSFAAKVDISTVNLQYGLALGDIDGDTKPDVVIANAGSSTISVYRNLSAIGSVFFGAIVDFPTGPHPYGVAMGDVDGDGKLDVVVADYSGSAISVLRNTSTIGSITTGTFAAKVDFTAGTRPISVALGDVDCDGKLDIAVVNEGSSTVSIFRNTSVTGSITTGSFAAKVDFATGTGPIGVALGDLDGVGGLDLAVTNYNAATLSLLRNSTCALGSICGTKFNDVNGDSLRQTTEPGLANWTISLTSMQATGPVTVTATTDSLGNYCFNNLTAGTYTVEEATQTGWQQTFPASPGTYTVTLAAGQNAGNVDFGNKQLFGSICGTKFN